MGTSILLPNGAFYGVDINPLAVEMAKLSLGWQRPLPTRPFTFLDHVLRSGNAILGADLQQVWNLGASIGRATVSRYSRRCSKARLRTPSKRDIGFLDLPVGRVRRTSVPR